MEKIMNLIGITRISGIIGIAIFIAIISFTLGLIGLYMNTKYFYYTTIGLMFIPLIYSYCKVFKICFFLFAEYTLNLKKSSSDKNIERPKLFFYVVLGIICVCLFVLLVFSAKNITPERRIYYNLSFLVYWVCFSILAYILYYVRKKYYLEILTLRTKKKFKEKEEIKRPNDTFLNNLFEFLKFEKMIDHNIGKAYFTNVFMDAKKPIRLNLDVPSFRYFYDLLKENKYITLKIKSFTACFINSSTSKPYDPNQCYNKSKKLLTVDPKKKPELDLFFNTQKKTW